MASSSSGSSGATTALIAKRASALNPEGRSKHVYRAAVSWPLWLKLKWTELRSLDARDPSYSYDNPFTEALLYVIIPALFLPLFLVIDAGAFLCYGLAASVDCFLNIVTKLVLGTHDLRVYTIVLFKTETEKQRLGLVAPPEPSASREPSAPPELLKPHSEPAPRHEQEGEAKAPDGRDGAGPVPAVLGANDVNLSALPASDTTDVGPLRGAVFIPRNSPYAAAGVLAAQIVVVYIETRNIIVEIEDSKRQLAELVLAGQVLVNLALSMWHMRKLDSADRFRMRPREQRLRTAPTFRANDSDVASAALSKGGRLYCWVLLRALAFLVQQIVVGVVVGAVIGALFPLLLSYVRFTVMQEEPVVLGSADTLLNLVALIVNLGAFNYLRFLNIDTGIIVNDLLIDMAILYGVLLTWVGVRIWVRNYVWSKEARKEAQRARRAQTLRHDPSTEQRPPQAQPQQEQADAQARPEPESAH